MKPSAKRSASASASASHASQLSNATTQPTAPLTFCDKKWYATFDRLLEYKKEHGDTMVTPSFVDPEKYKGQAKLGNWVMMQRRLRRINCLAPKREKRLDEIEFFWGKETKASDSNKVANDKRWNAMFDRLLEYRAQHGKVWVPRGYKDPEKHRGKPKLSDWVRRQQKYSDKGILEDDRKDRLNQIGFIWNVSGYGNVPTTSNLVGDRIRPGIETSPIDTGCKSHHGRHNSAEREVIATNTADVQDNSQETFRAPTREMPFPEARSVRSCDAPEISTEGENQTFLEQELSPRSHGGSQVDSITKIHALPLKSTGGVDSEYADIQSSCNLDFLDRIDKDYQQPLLKHQCPGFAAMPAMRTTLEGPTPRPPSSESILQLKSFQAERSNATSGCLDEQAEELGDNVARESFAYPEKFNGNRKHGLVVHGHRQLRRKVTRVAPETEERLNGRLFGGHERSNTKVPGVSIGEKGENLFEADFLPITAGTSDPASTGWRPTSHEDNGDSTRPTKRSTNADPTTQLRNERFECSASANATNVHLPATGQVPAIGEMPPRMRTTSNDISQLPSRSMFAASRIKVEERNHDTAMMRAEFGQVAQPPPNVASVARIKTEEIDPTNDSDGEIESITIGGGAVESTREQVMVVRRWLKEKIETLRPRYVVDYARVLVDKGYDSVEGLEMMLRTQDLTKCLDFMKEGHRMHLEVIQNNLE